MQKSNLIGVCVLLLVIITIAVNIAANVVPLNGLTTGEVSDLYPTYFVPAGYVFTIWSLIYLGIIVFALYQLKTQAGTIMPIRLWFIISCVANSVWIVLWHYGYIYFTVPVMVVLLVSLIMIYQQSKLMPIGKKFEYWCVRAPFSVYLGWISVATIANISAALYAANWNGFGLAPQIWSVIMMSIAAVLAISMLLREKDYLYALVIVWALIGIGVRFGDIAIIYNSAYALAGLVTIGIVGVCIRKLNQRSGSKL